MDDGLLLPVHKIEGVDQYHKISMFGQYLLHNLQKTGKYNQAKDGKSRFLIRPMCELTLV